MTPTNATAKELFECGIAALGRADLPAAQAAFLKCVELSPESADAWCYLGMAFSAKEHERAAEALERALAIDPNHHGAIYWRAEMHWVEGNAGFAARLLRHLNNIVPDSSNNLARLGLAYLAAGESDSAMEVLSEAVDAGGGGASVSFDQSELRRAIYLDLLGRCEESSQLIQSVNGAGVAADIPVERYPRDLEVQRCALENVVAGRDIVIMGSGPSLERLQPILMQLGQSGCENLCFFGFNNVPVAESMLQQTIGRNVDIACMTSASVMELHSAWMEEFLGRRTSPNLFLTLGGALPEGSVQAALSNRWTEKFFYFTSHGDYPPIATDPLHFPPINTLMCVLPLAALGQPRRIFLFGCDGVAPDSISSGAPVYFKQGSAEYGQQSEPSADLYAKWLARDTFFFNAYISTVLQCLAVLHKISLPPIAICNPDSAYRPFPRVDVEKFLELHLATEEVKRLIPARIRQMQMQRQLDCIKSQLDHAVQQAREAEAKLAEEIALHRATVRAQDQRIEVLQREVSVLLQQMEVIKRYTSPLRGLRRLF